MKQKIRKILASLIIVSTIIIQLPTVLAGAFSDVPTSSPYANAIETLKNENIISGYADGTFKPEQNINRAEFLKILIEANKNIQVNLDEKNLFPDTPKDSWYSKYVSTAKTLQIVKGYDDGTFKPEQNISSAEAFKIVIETYKLKTVDNESNYPQFKNEWYYKYLSTIEKSNLLEIPKDFDPNTKINRQETAQLILNAKNNAEKTTQVNIDNRNILPGEPYPTYSYLTLPSSNGLITSNLNSPYRLPVNYVNINQPLQIKLYKSDSTTAVNELPIYSWNNSTISEDAIKKMTLIKDFSTELLKSKEADSYYSQTGYLDLPITDKGTYFISISSKEFKTIQSFINVTDLNISVTKENANEAKKIIWVTDSKTKEVISDAKITTYYKAETSDLNEAPADKIEEGKTNTDGIYLTLNNKSDQNFVIAEKNNDQAILYNYSYVTAQNDSKLKEYKIYSYTDRPIYRPGNTVNFKSILRINDQGAFSLPPKTEVNVTASTYDQNYAEKKVFEKKFTTNEFGTINGSFNLNSDAATGNYSMSFKAVDGIETYENINFQVEAYKKDDYSITISPDKEQYINNETVNATISANYYYGAPVTNQEVSYTVYRQNSLFPPCYGDICPMYKTSFYPYAEKETITSGKVNLDNNGLAKINFKASLDSKNYSENPNNQATFTIEVTTTGSNKIEVNNTKEIIVNSSNIVVAADAEYYPAQVGKAYPIKITTTDLSNQIAPNTSLKIKITQNTYHQVLDSQIKDEISNTMYPYYRYENESKVVLDTTATTNKDGIYSFNYTPDKTANYSVEITAIDQNQNSSKTFMYFDTNQYGDYYLYSYQQDLTISTDKNEYALNDTAKITIKNQSDQKYALVVLGKNKIIDFKVLKLEKDNDKYTTSFNQNLDSKFVSGFVINATSQNQFGQLNTITQNVSVKSPNQKLKIEITTDKSNPGPKETVKFSVKVKDENNKPVKAEISLALVDQALLDLVNSNKNDIYDYFYQAQNYFYLPTYNLERVKAIDTSTANTADQSITKESYGTTTGGGITGTPAPTMARDEASAISAESPVSNIRSNFADTAYWIGSLQTDSNGLATTTVTLPDNLTTWSAATIANTKQSQFGSQTYSFKSSKDFITTSYLPRFVTENDQVDFKFSLNNLNLDSGDYTATLGGTGFKVSSSAMQKVSVSKGTSKVISFPVKIDSSKNLNQITVTLNLTNSNNRSVDALQLNLPLNPVGLEKVSVQSGIDNGTLNIKAASGDIKNIRKLELNLSPTIADNLTSSLEYLVGYPYGCVEQTMSKFLPNIVVYSNKDKLKFHNTDIFKDLDKQVQSGLDKLYSLQHSDGGWGWWESDESIAKNTAYVVYGLNLTKKAGFKVDDAKFQAGANRLKTFFADNKETKIKPYLAYVLSQLDSNFQPNLKSSLDSIAKSKDLSNADLAYISIAYNNLGDKVSAQKYLDQLKSKITTSGEDSYFEEKTIDYENMESNTLTTAVALNALVQIEPDSVLIPRIISYFNHNNLGNQYGETHALAQAVIALSTYITKTSELNPDYNYSVKLNGKIIGSGKLNQFRKISIDTSTLNANGENKIEISKQGSGKLYFTLNQTEFLPENNISAANNGFSVTRTYLDESGKVKTSFKTGEIVRVNLNVKNSQDSYYTAITDFLPAGFEPVNPNLKKDQKYGSTPIYYYYEDYSNLGIKDVFQGEYSDHRDLLDNKTVLFRTNLPSGEHDFSYYARVVNTGTFNANPTKAEMMYAPEINGNSKLQKITINN